MKPSNFILSLRSRLCRDLFKAPVSIIVCLSGAISLSGMAAAATQYWDPGLTPTANDGKGSGGDGTWTAAGANWTDGTADATLATTNVAGFAGSAISSTVGLTASIVVAGVQFDTNNYVIGNGTTSGQISIVSQTAGPTGISVTPGVTGTSIDVGSIKLGSQASGTDILLTNTDLINFNSTTVYLTGSRVNKISNSSSSATTTYQKFGLSDKPNGGTWPNTNTALNVGNLTITTLAAAANANGSLSSFSSTAPVNATFSGSGSGTFTLNGNNTLLNNPGVGGALSLTFNMANGTLALGHDNALGARNVSNALTTTSLIMSSGTVVASGGARIIDNKLTINGTAAIGGSNSLTFTNDLTNSGGSRTLNVNNTAATTFSGAVYLANDNATSRTFTIGGTGNPLISGAISNNASGNTLASSLTKSGTGTLTLAGTNNYTGNTTINSGSTLTLANTGSLKFVVQPASTSNKITGSGLVNLNGIINIDTSGAGTPTIGNKWTLVEASATYGATFSITGLTETSPGSGYYVDGTNNWYFGKLSGKLSYGVLPENVWDGDSGGAWSVGGNWAGGIAPASGDTLNFTGSNTTNNNDLSTGTAGTVALEGILFAPSASSFSLNGNAVNLAGKSITNYSANTQTLAFNIEANTGFSVNTSAGDVTLTGSLNTTTSFNKPLNKNGTGTLILNGTQNTTWSLNVNAGTMQVFNPNTAGQVTAYTATISSGATLKAESGDIFHFSLPLTNNGTFDISAAGESFGSLLGTGVVTNHGASSAVTCMISLGSGNSNFSGSIQNGPLGAPTAVTLFDQNTADLEYYINTFSGPNTYTGDTTITNKDVAFSLTSTGSLAFKVGANGVNTKITGVDQTAGVGTVTLDGTFNIDLSGAALANGNSWQIVSATLLPTTTFGSNFAVAGFTESSNVWTKVAGSNTWTFSESTGVLSLAVSAQTGFSSWVGGFGLAAGDQDPTDDADHDGFNNILEYVLGGNPASGSTSISPTGVKSGTNFVLTFTRSDLSENDVVTSVQYGNNLVGWTKVVVPASSSTVSGVSFAVTPNTPSAGLDKVVATIPNASASSFFARVNAVK